MVLPCLLLQNLGASGLVPISIITACGLHFIAPLYSSVSRYNLPRTRPHNSWRRNSSESRVESNCLLLFNIPIQLIQFPGAVFSRSPSRFSANSSRQTFYSNIQHLFRTLTNKLFFFGLGAVAKRTQNGEGNEI